MLLTTKSASETSEVLPIVLLHPTSFASVWQRLIDVNRYLICADANIQRSADRGIAQAEVTARHAIVLLDLVNALQNRARLIDSKVRLRSQTVRL